MEKLAFALITASRKLRHYFQAHVINVMTDCPLKKVTNKLEAAGRLIQWAVELSEFDIKYQPRHAIKAQALADFIAEFTLNCDEVGEKENIKWVVYVDGSFMQYAGGVGVVLQSPEGDKLKHKVRLQYQTTNNEAKYEALLKGMELAKSVKAESLLILGDSQLIIGQVNGVFEAKEERMRKYLNRVMRLIKKFEEVSFVQIPREENMEADALAKEASAIEAVDEVDEIQYMPSIDIPEVQQMEGRPSWMTPIVSYLKDGRLPEEKDEARKLRVRAARYVLMDEILYKRGFSQPYLRCLAPDEANYTIREIHEGACGNHSRARSLVHKIVRAGYYWPSMQADAKAYVKVCDQCQRFSNVQRQPSEYLTPMTAPWPFAQWGLDILGPFPLGVRQMKFLIVGIDYFTKWVEAESLANITQQNVKNFVWKNIVCRFGVPRVLVLDNGWQFDNALFRDFCLHFRIQNHYSSPAHPQANGQAEVANRSLLKLIKTRLEGAKGVWPDKLPGVLWAYRTTARTPTGETPFKLAYGTEAVIPAEVHMANHRVAAYQDKDNEEQLRLNLDLIDEVRMDAEQRMTRYKNLMARQYDAMVKPRRFSVGDLVLKRVSLATKNPAHGKLGPNWEGPYRVVNCKRQGSYYLEGLDGRKLEHPWNVEHLRKYYQ
nr:gypsy retrotransposon integrase-like protein 1 [Quercus suber]